MEIIDKNHPKYSKVVEDSNEREYAIDSNKMTDGDQVICPHDKDMSVSLLNGEVLISKQTYSKRCFSK